MGHNPLVSNRDENPSAVEFLRGIYLQNQQSEWLKLAIIEVYEKLDALEKTLAGEPEIKQHDVRTEGVRGEDQDKFVPADQPPPEAEPTPQAEAPAKEAVSPPKKGPGRPKKSIAEAAGAEA